MALSSPPRRIQRPVVFTLVKNLPKGAGETVHIVAFTPEPRIIQLELAPQGEHKVMVGELSKTAIHDASNPGLGVWLKLFTTLLGRMPPDYHAWILTDEVPAFVRFEGPLYPTGPVGGSSRPAPRRPD